MTTKPSSLIVRSLPSAVILGVGEVAVSDSDSLGGAFNKGLVFIGLLVVALTVLWLFLRQSENERRLARSVTACALLWGALWTALGAIALSLQSGWGAGQILPLSGLLIGPLCGATFAALMYRFGGTGRARVGTLIGNGVASAVIVSVLCSLPETVIQRDSFRDWAGIVGSMLVLFVPLAAVSGPMSGRIVGRGGGIDG